VSNSEEVPSQLYHRLVEQLRSTDVRYHELVNQLPEVVLELDLQGRLTFLNAAWFDELGYPAEESIGKSVYQFVPKEHHAPIAHILSGASPSALPSRVAGDAATPTLELPFIHQAGRRIWYQFTMATAQPNRRLGLLHNIDSRKRTEDLLRDSEARKVAILEAAIDCIFTADHEGRILEFNPAAERTFGYRKADVLYRPISDLIDQDSFRRLHSVGVAQALRERSGSAVGRRFEVSCQRANGTKFPAEVAITAVHLDGRLLFTTYLRDITEARRAAEALRRKEEEARKLALVAATTDNLVVITDSKGNIEWVNEAFTRLTEYTLAEVLGRRPGQFLQGAETNKSTIAYMHNQVVQGHPFKAEILNYSKSGRRYWIDLEVQPIRDAEGELRNFIAVERDITERKNAVRELHLAKEAAEAANRSKSQFLANISHEVRTPMGAILGFADMLLDPKLPADERGRCLRAIRRNGHHLLELLNDVLDLSKIEAGKLDIIIEPCSPWKVASEVYSFLRVRAEEKGINFALVPQGSLPESFDTDIGRLRQILVNFLSNAIKFTDRDKNVRLILKAELDVKPSVSWMSFIVEDEGIGIRPERMADLFQPFQQLDSSMTRRFGGTGLGLSICKKLSQLLGGSVSATSEPGRGSRFILRLPLAVHKVSRWVRAAEFDEGAPSIDSYIDENPVSMRGRILVAEDTKDIRRILNYHLTRAGFAVEFAEDGKAAIDMALTDAFDVILMDMQMPEIDGYEATRQLRQQGYRRPIIALTAHAMHGEREKCLNAGCDEYLAKPVDAMELVALIARFLAEERAPAAGELQLPSEDDEFRALVREYRASLLVNVEELRQAFGAGDLRRVKALAHRNKGTAAVFSFPELSEIAGLLEEAIGENQDGSLLRELVDEFCQCATRIATAER
jgi:PAS domain S-box-containing protein